MYFFVLKAFLILATSAFVFGEKTIELQPLDSTPIVNYNSTSDTCGKIVARTNQIYHVSTQNVFQSIPKVIFSMNTNILNVSSPPLQVTDFDVSQT